MFLILKTLYLYNSNCNLDALQKSDRTPALDDAQTRLLAFVLGSSEARVEFGAVGIEDALQNMNRFVMLEDNHHVNQKDDQQDH